MPGEGFAGRGLPGLDGEALDAQDLDVLSPLSRGAEAAIEAGEACDGLDRRCGFVIGLLVRRGAGARDGKECRNENAYGLKFHLMK